MENTEVYAIILSGIFGGLFVAARLPMLYSITKSIYILILKGLAYTFILRRHRWVGPWTIGEFMLQTLYIATNLVCILFRVSSISEASVRAGRLSLINMIPLFLGPHLGFLADLFGIPVRTFHNIHYSYGAMSSSLAVFHAGVMATLGEQQDIYVSAGAVSLAVISVLSIPILRHTFYEVFLRIHQALAIFAASSIWWHLYSIPRYPWQYIYIYGGLSCLLCLIQIGLAVYRNKSWGSPLPRLLIRKDCGDICVTVELSRSVQLEAGQYINLWICAPRVSLWSWIQSHPFTVASWSPTKQSSLKLFIEPRKGFTSKLLQTDDIKKMGDDASLSYLAVFTGPHGICFPVWNFKTVLMFATGFGIVAMLPYLEKLIHDHKYYTARTHRIHLVWHVEDLWQFSTILDLLNQRLKDDAIGKGYIFHISIYNECGLEEKEFGKHGRVAFFVGAPNPQTIINREQNGDFIQPIKKGGAQMGNGGRSSGYDDHCVTPKSLERCSLCPSEPSSHPIDHGHSHACDNGGMFHRDQKFQSDKGKVLVLVSGTPELRDELRKLVRGYLSKRVRLKELDYQSR